MDIVRRYYAVGVAILLFVVIAEGLVLRYRRGHYDWKAFGISFGDRVGTILLEAAIPFTLAGPLLDYLYGHRLFSLPVRTLSMLAALYLAQEFFYYWSHRAAHRVRWFWATHAVHHTSDELSFAAAFRLGMVGKLTGSTFFYAPMAWLGFEPRVIYLAVTGNLIYQFWIHADWIPKLGPLEYVLNTPSHHRVHHARQLDYLDANFGGILIVFDRLFGTFVEEREDLPCDYGLVKPVAKYNPIIIEGHVWAGMVRDVLGARSLKDAFFYVFGPPGWAPDGRGTTTEDLRAAARAAEPVAG